MATYDNLDPTITQIAEAAIESSMAWMGFKGDVHQGFQGAYSSVTRPDRHGGGGLVTDILGDKTKFENTGPLDVRLPPGSSVAEQVYNPWYTAVRDAFADWQDLPDPAGFTGKVRAMESAAKSISVTASAQGGQVHGANGALNGALTSMSSELAPFNGRIIDTFSEMFVNQLPTAIAGQSGIAVVLGTHLAAEEELWRRARKDVCSIADAVLVAMKAAQPQASSPAGLTALLSVVGTAASALSIFAAPLAGTVATAAGVLSTFLPEPQQHGQPEIAFGAATPDAVYQNLLDGLGKLNGQISDQESDIVTKTMACAHTVLADRNDGFRIGTPKLLSQHDECGIVTRHNIAFGLNEIHTITHQYMPKVQGFLRGAYDAASPAVGAAPWMRPASIGYGPEGAYSAWSQLYDLFMRLVGTTAWEVQQGAEVLDIAINHVHRTDVQVGSANAALRRHADKIQFGSPYGDPTAPTGTGPDGPRVPAVL